MGCARVSLRWLLLGCCERKSKTKMNTKVESKIKMTKAKRNSSMVLIRRNTETYEKRLRSSSQVMN